MTTRKSISYAITIFFFAAAFWLTMIIPEKVIRALWEFNNFTPNINTYRLLIQKELFIYGLVFSLLFINLIETLTTHFDNFPIRLLKSFLTIIFTYTLGAIIYFLLGSPKAWCLYYYHTGIPAMIFFALTAALTLFGLIILELVFRFFFFFIAREKVAKNISLLLRGKSKSIKSTDLLNTSLN